MCLFNNVMTRQCNLSEINMGNVVDAADFYERCEAAAVIGTMQAAYTEFPYLGAVTQSIVEREALIGVSMTGIASGPVLELDMKAAAKIAEKENKRVADIIGIRPAARTTCVKPAGTTSLALGTSSGIHAWHSDYYIRRIRVGKDEAIYNHLLTNHPNLLEDEYFRPHDTAVISVPQRAPECAILRAESATNLLSRVKDVNRRWIRPGHKRGQNSHNISATISIRENEWEKVGKWMWQNRKFYNGLSVLPYDGGTYKQAPFEECTKEEYENLLLSLKKLDLTKVIEYDDNTDLTGELACAGGACEIR